MAAVPDFGNDGPPGRNGPGDRGGRRAAARGPSAPRPSRAGGLPTARITSIRYRPKGHAGDFMRTWLDRSAAGRPSPAHPAPPAAPIFATLSDPYSPGRCMKCHSVERAMGRRPRSTGWPAARRRTNTSSPSSPTYPHFSLLGEKGCQTCHVLNKNADVGTRFRPRRQLPQHGRQRV